MKFWVTLTHIFLDQTFLSPQKITFRELCKELCNDTCTKNTFVTIAENTFRKYILLACFSCVIIKQVDFFHKKVLFFSNAQKIVPSIVIIFI